MSEDSRCEACEWVENTRLGQLHREYLLGLPCPEHDRPAQLIKQSEQIGVLEQHVNEKLRQRLASERRAMILDAGVTIADGDKPLQDLPVITGIWTWKEAERAYSSLQPDCPECHLPVNRSQSDARYVVRNEPHSWWHASCLYGPGDRDLWRSAWPMRRTDVPLWLNLMDTLSWVLAALLIVVPALVVACVVRLCLPRTHGTNGL